MLVSVERTKMVTFQSLVLAGGAALLFSLYVVLSKFVYEGQPFFVWGLMWIVGGSFLGSLLLLVSKDLRNEIKNVLQKRGASKQTLSPKVISLFAGNQIIGALGYVVQNYAVALTPFAFIAFVNALEGIKYVFVLAMATFLSVVFPRVVQERLDAKSITQKLVAISLIGVGLVLLAL